MHAIGIVNDIAFDWIIVTFAVVNYKHICPPKSLQ